MCKKSIEQRLKEIGITHYKANHLRHHLFKGNQYLGAFTALEATELFLI